jgi:hypothetical protein
MFFIVTTGRSGSTTLARVLSQHPLCYCSHEQHRVLVKLATERCYSQIDDVELRFYLALMFPHRVGLKLYGESNQKLSYLIPLLAELGRIVKFIWLIRDGRDVVASIFSRGWYGEEKVTSENFPWVKYRIQGDLCGDLSTETWSAMTPFEKCCWYWSYTNRTIARDLENVDKATWTMVKLEELFGSLDNILAFLDLPFYPLKVIRANSNPVSTHRFEVWNREQREAFDFWCGSAMDNWYSGWRESVPRIQQRDRDENSRNVSVNLFLTVSSHTRWFIIKSLRNVMPRVTSYSKSIPN